MLYRCVTGRLPYRAANLVAMLTQLREGRAPHVCDLAPDVDKRFGAIVDKAIEWDKNARYANALEFRKALVDWTRDLARVERILTDFLDKPPSDRDVSAAAAPQAPAPAAADDHKTRRYPGEDVDAQLMDNLHASEDDEAGMPPESERFTPKGIPRKPVETTKTKKRRREPSVRMRDQAKTIPDDPQHPPALKRIPSVEIELDFDEDDEKTIPKHGGKRQR
jgi:hypothetical protein